MIFTAIQYLARMSRICPGSQLTKCAVLKIGQWNQSKSKVLTHTININVSLPITRLSKFQMQASMVDRHPCFCEDVDSVDWKCWRRKNTIYLPATKIDSTFQPNHLASSTWQGYSDKLLIRLILQQTVQRNILQDDSNTWEKSRPPPQLWLCIEQLAQYPSYEYRSGGKYVWEAGCGRFKQHSFFAWLVSMKKQQSK